MPDALLLVSSHCPHCPAALAALSGLVKSGALGRLEIVNLDVHPETAVALGVRSVPWARLGPFELAGVHSADAYTDWAARADSEAGIADGFHLLLKDGQLAQVQASIEREPALLAALLPIVGNIGASLNVRLGAGVLFETFADSAALAALIPALGELTQHADPRVRADACHTLGLAADPQARVWLVARLEDADADVREIAAESLAGLPD